MKFFSFYLGFFCLLFTTHIIKSALILKKNPPCIDVLVKKHGMYQDILPIEQEELSHSDDFLAKISILKNNATVPKLFSPNDYQRVTMWTSMPHTMLENIVQNRIDPSLSMRAFYVYIPENRLFNMSQCTEFNNIINVFRLNTGHDDLIGSHRYLLKNTVHYEKALVDRIETFFKKFTTECIKQAWAYIMFQGCHIIYSNPEDIFVYQYK